MTDKGHECRACVHFDKRGEDGQIHMEPEDVGQIGAYSHLMVEILKDQLDVAREEATDAESLRKNYDRVYDRIKREYEEDKYAIVATDKTQGEPKTIPSEDDLIADGIGQAFNPD